MTLWWVPRPQYWIMVTCIMKRPCIASSVRSMTAVMYIWLHYVDRYSCLMYCTCFIASALVKFCQCTGCVSSYMISCCCCGLGLDFGLDSAPGIVNIISSLTDKIADVIIFVWSTHSQRPSRQLTV